MPESPGATSIRGGREEAFQSLDALVRLIRKRSPRRWYFRVISALAKLFLQ